MSLGFVVFFFFFQAEDGIRDVAVTGVQTCALPISAWAARSAPWRQSSDASAKRRARGSAACSCRSEEHTSELQSRLHLVCRLLLEKKKIKSKDVTSQQKISDVRSDCDSSDCSGTTN